MARARKIKRQDFFVDDLALYIYERSGKTYIVPVMIQKVHRKLLNPEAKSPKGWRYALTYTVYSHTGGEMTALPENLRPDTVLDRIDLALMRDEQSATS